MAGGVVIVLGIETATIAVGCALVDDGVTIGSFQVENGRHHVETLTPAIEFLLTQARVSYADIDMLAVDHGPGLFTGLRVGVSAAKATALALSKPLVGVSSLDALAYAARAYDGLLVPVLDARRGELFAATYRCANGSVERTSDYFVGTAEAWAKQLPANAAVFGDGRTRYPEALASFDSPITDRAPSALAIAQLGYARRASAEAPEKLEPLYLRRSDAEVNRDRHAAVGAK